MQYIKVPSLPVFGVDFTYHKKLLSHLIIPDTSMGIPFLACHELFQLLCFIFGSCLWMYKVVASDTRLLCLGLTKKKKKNLLYLGMRCVQLFSLIFTWEGDLVIQFCRILYALTYDIVHDMLDGNIGIWKTDHLVVFLLSFKWELHKSKNSTRSHNLHMYLSRCNICRNSNEIRWL